MPSVGNIDKVNMQYKGWQGNPPMSTFLTRLRLIDGEITARGPRHYGSCFFTKLLLAYDGSLRLPCKTLFPQALKLTQAFLVWNRMLLAIGYRFLLFHCHPMVIFVEISLMCHCSYLQVLPAGVPAKALIASKLLRAEVDALSSIPPSLSFRH